jgi:5-methyltetrahydrofolate--homocysteine methyltransferase
MSRFLDALHSGRVLLMDGATGTELQRAGIREGECSEAWNITQPDRVRAIHQAYVDAGADVLLTNTFQGNPQALARHGIDRLLMPTYNRAALEIASSARPRHGFILGDVGPWEGSALSEIDAVVCSLGDADGILLETFADVAALGYVDRLRRGTGRRLPFLLSLAFHRDGSGKLSTPSGYAPEEFARRTKECGVDALGVNCGRDIGMDDVIEVIRRYRSVTDLPLFARPNAGTPTRDADRWVYPLTPEAMAAKLPTLLEAGVSMLGGCCGTTPAHIAACKPITDDWNARRSGVRRPL